jgi:hypothetical protein
VGHKLYVEGKRDERKQKVAGEARDAGVSAAGLWGPNYEFEMAYMYK